MGPSFARPPQSLMIMGQVFLVVLLKDSRTNKWSTYPPLAEVINLVNIDNKATDKGA